jgi:GntR family transcriptional regulator
MALLTAHEIKAVSSNLPTPLYHQIYSLIRHKIEAGEWRHGAMVPSESEISQLFSVSRITAKRALDDLEQEHFVERRRGRGTSVSYTYEPKVLRAPLTGMLESLHVMGKETSAKVLSLERVSAGKTVAEALEIPTGSLVDRAVRLRLNQSEPFGYYVSHTLPLEKPLTIKALQTKTRLEIFREMGIRITEVDQVLSAVAATPEVALALATQVGAPLLTVSRIYLDQHHRRIDHLYGVYRPDRFQYHMHLSSNERRK